MLIMLFEFVPKTHGTSASGVLPEQGLDFTSALHMGWRHGLVEATSSLLRRGIGLEEGYLNAA